MTQRWVTIEGRHVLIKDRTLTGGGHEGVHDPATETGNVQVDAILKSRLLPAIKTPEGNILIGHRGQYHWQVMYQIQPPGKTFGEMLDRGYKRGFEDVTTHKFYDKLPLDASEITRPLGERNSE